MWPHNTYDFDIRNHTVLMTLGGSHAYGTNIATSDKDYRGVLIEPLSTRLSPYKNVEQILYKVEDKDYEGTIFALDKFFILASACNPNVIEILFVNEADILACSEGGRLLIDNRKLFLNKRAAYSFSAYGMGQLKRIQNHKQWLLNPPKKVPTRSDFNLPETPIMSKDQMGAANTLIQRYLNSEVPWLLTAKQTESMLFWESLIVMNNFINKSTKDLEAETKDSIARGLGMETNFIEMLNNEKAYTQAKTHYAQYQEWLVTRNKTRAALEHDFGYDTKHAMHLVRLMRMGQELLQTGELIVKRPDAEELLAIRQGRWSYEKLLDFATTSFTQLKIQVKGPDCPLEEKSDVDKLNSLHHKIITEFYDLQAT